MSKFDEYKKYFDTDNVEALIKTRDGLLWLLVKSISRKELVNNFIKFSNIELKSKNIAEQFKELYDILALNIEKSHKNLTDFIKNNTILFTTEEEKAIESELFKLRNFNWGGDYTNALDKFLVDRYIKIYKSYEEISEKLTDEIPKAVNGYVMCSWYNHWSTILIENIFKQHTKVLPALGNIKRTDFFIEEVPFDLKTTYLPLNFLESKRKIAGLKKELSELKRVANKHGIPFDKKGKDRDVQYEIIEKIKDSNIEECINCVANINIFRKNLIQSCIADPKELIKNLYEEQGATRFDAANRIYIILVDINDFENSWQLKRNATLLKQHINNYLDSFTLDKISSMKITFTHKAKSGEFSAISDAIFIVRDIKL
jgi:hypothetical protein